MTDQDSHGQHVPGTVPDPFGYAWDPSRITEDQDIDASVEETREQDEVGPAGPDEDDTVRLGELD